MAFDALERSNYDGIPVALYEFALGNVFWRYASDEADVVTSGLTYTAIPISDSGLQQSGDINNDDLTITMPASSDLVKLFRGTPPAESIFLSMRRKHRGDADAPIIWVGTVSNVRIISATSAEVICRMLTSTFDRNGLRLSWGRGCPHALYDSACRINKASFGVTVQISTLLGGGLRSTPLGSYTAGWFNGGFIEWITEQGFIDRRAVESHSSNLLTIFGTTDGLEVGQYITVYPGCDRTSSTCEGKFNNLLNYGGFPHLPGKSPFDGDPVF